MITAPKDVKSRIFITVSHPARSAKYPKPYALAVLPTYPALFITPAKKPELA